MAKKNIFDWEKGAVLEEHSKKKHQILGAYFREYLITRCQHPQQKKFRLIVVDAFAGGGLYTCGTYGSPLLLLDTLSKTTTEINLSRINKGFQPVDIECLFIFNDTSTEAIEKLKENIAPVLVQTEAETSNLSVIIEYLNDAFLSLYPSIKKRVLYAKCQNVFFSLDQNAYADVPTQVIRDISQTWRSAETLLTYSITSLLAFLSPKKNNQGTPLEAELRESIDKILEDVTLLNKKEWLGQAERIIYSYLKGCAPFMSPFSINNPTGWRYWLMHFANSYRARQVYNDILHENSESQAHFGRPGLEMLSFDPKDEGQLYLFNKSSRKLAKASLYDDIPNFIAESGDTISVSDFYTMTYSETPAHSDDINQMMIENPDVEILTNSGGLRRQSNTIKPEDTLKLTNQKSFIFLFPED